MPDAYVSQIDFGDGIVRKLKAEGGGMYIGNVTSFNAAVSAGVKKVTLTWTDPDDIVIGGVTQVEWGGTVIVRKAGSIPASSGDGTVIVDNKVRNQYSTNGFEDTNVDFDTVYYYRAFPYTTSGQSTAGSYTTVEIPAIHIYGVEWDGTATTAWTRTDESADFVDPVIYYSGMTGTPSSPFDNLTPWCDMNIVEDATAGTLVSIPKFYYKWTQNGNGLKLQIATGPVEGFRPSPAHMDKDDGQGERAIVYVGRYCCGNDGKSATGKSLQEFQPSTALSTIHSLGDELWSYDFAMYWTLNMLYLVEFADWNSQKVLGYINPSGNTGITDDIPYHTGATVTDLTAYQAGRLQYRHIEDFISCPKAIFCAGINIQKSSPHSYYLALNPSKFNAGTNASGEYYEYTNKLPNSYRSYISSWRINTNDDYKWAWALIPVGLNGTETTYSCDAYDVDGLTDNNNLLVTAGRSSYSSLSGAFMFEVVGYSTSYHAARLQKLPNNT